MGILAQTSSSKPDVCSYKSGSIPKSQHPHPKMRMTVKASISSLSVLSLCNSVKQLYICQTTASLINEDSKFQILHLKQIFLADVGHWITSDEYLFYKRRECDKLPPVIMSKQIKLLVTLKKTCLVQILYIQQYIFWNLGR